MTILNLKSLTFDDSKQEKEAVEKNNKHFRPSGGMQKPFLLERIIWTL